MGIHRTYPYPAYGGLAPVPGGQGEQRDDIADPIILSDDIGREKGYKLRSCIALAPKVKRAYLHYHRVHTRHRQHLHVANWFIYELAWYRCGALQSRHALTRSPPAVSPHIQGPLPPLVVQPTADC